MHRIVMYMKNFNFMAFSVLPQMDSGGPLLWQDPTTCKCVVVGIVSAGVACASNQPGLNVRVGAYIWDWILSVTGKIQQKSKLEV